MSNDVTKDIIDVMWQAVAYLMDDDIREQVHGELAPCTQKEFMHRYLELDPDFAEIIGSEFGPELYEAICE